MGYFLNTLSRIWETVLEAVGGHLTLGLGGILFLGFPASFWCGAYGYAVSAKAGLPVSVSLTIGIVLSAVMGVIFTFFYSRMSNDSFAVMTLASVLGMDALIRTWDSVTGGVLGIAGVPRFFPDQTLQSLVIFGAIIAIACLVFESVLLKSPFGRALRAIKENKTALVSLGTSAKLTGQIAILFASLFTGIAGILVVMKIQFLDPSLGGLFMLAQILTISMMASSPKATVFFGATTAVVLLPEILRFFNLPVSILGYSRNLLYGLLLIVLIYYSTGKNKAKRYV